MDSYEANRVCPSLIGRCPFKRMISRGLIDSAICVCMPPNRTPWYLTLDEEALQLLREEQDKISNIGCTITSLFVTLVGANKKLMIFPTGKKTYFHTDTKWNFAKHRETVESNTNLAY